MKKLVYMIIVLTVIGLISGGILSLVYSAMVPRINENLVKATDEAIFKVLPETKNYQQKKSGEVVYYECYDAAGAKVGLAILCAGNGYQGEIKMMVGINADLTKFTGLSVLEQVETPGLGAKIAEKSFADQFNGLAATPPIEYVKGIKPGKPNEIAAITGATISSRSVVNIINKAVEEVMNKK